MGKETAKCRRGADGHNGLRLGDRLGAKGCAGRFQISRRAGAVDWVNSHPEYVLAMTKVARSTLGGVAISRLIADVVPVGERPSSRLYAWIGRILGWSFPDLVSRIRRPATDEELGEEGYPV